MGDLPLIQIVKVFSSINVQNACSSRIDFAAHEPLFAATGSPAPNVQVSSIAAHVARAVVGGIV
jgi:hypothetical protein